MENPTAFLMIGPPGAGKSTYARKLSAKTGAFIIEGDSLREEVGELWTDLEDAIVAEIETAPGDVILDCPHCDRTERRKATDLLMGFGYDVIAVVLTTPIEECILRNAVRAKSVPRHAITRWIGRYEKELSVLPSEPFKEIITIP